MFHVLPCVPPVESCFSPGVDSPPAVAPMASQDEKTRPENHQENHLDAQEDEGSGQERYCLQVAAGQRHGHR